MSIQKVPRLIKNFVLPTIRTWFPPFSTMLTLNPKVNTVPRNSRSVFGQQIDPCTNFHSKKSLLFWPALGNKNK